MTLKRKTPGKKDSLTLNSFIAIIIGTFFLILISFYFLNKIFASAYIFLFLISPIFFIIGIILKIFSQQENAHILFSMLGTLLSLASFFLINDGNTPTCFNNLEELQKFSEKLMQRKVEMENSNLLKPSYDKYYASLRPSFFNSRLKAVFRFLRISPKQVWNAASVEGLIKQSLEIVKKSNFPKGDFVSKLALSENSKVVVVGDVMGTFDSFVRDLSKLKELDFIDSNFKIKKPTDFIFLTGDAVSRSPYQLELLSLLLKLFVTNPTQFIYIKGNHESDNYWKEFSLKTELHARLNNVTSDNQNFEDLVSQFFATLPSGVYLKTPTPELHFIRISHYGAERSPYFVQESENKFFTFLSLPQEPGIVSFMSFNQVREESPEKNVPLVAILKSEKKRESYQDMDGLRLLSPENGVTAWTVMSCPSEIFQKGLKFFFDAFVVLSFGKNLETDYKISLYKQDVRIKTGFTSREANLTTGQDAGTTDKPSTATETKKPDITSPIPATASNLTNKVAPEAPKEVVAAATTTNPKQTSSTPSVAANKPDVKENLKTEPTKDKIVIPKQDKPEPFSEQPIAQQSEDYIEETPEEEVFEEAEEDPQEQSSEK